MGGAPSPRGGRRPAREPYYLLHEGTRLRLEFDCARCEMRVINEPTQP